MTNNKGVSDIKTILIGLMFVVLIASLFLVMIESFGAEYKGYTNESQVNQSYQVLEAVGANSDDYQELVQEYNASLYGSQTSGELSWFDFMWKGAWSILRGAVTLPARVSSIVQVSMAQVGVPEVIVLPILVFVSSILLLIVIFAAINRLPLGKG